MTSRRSALVRCVHESNSAGELARERAPEVTRRVFDHRADHEAAQRDRVPAGAQPDPLSHAARFNGHVEFQRGREAADSREDDAAVVRVPEAME